MLTKFFITARLALADRDQGATAAEYGLLVALIAVVLIISINLLSGSIQDAFTAVSDSINGVVNPAP